MLPGWIGGESLPCEQDDSISLDRVELDGPSNGAFEQVLAGGVET
jgi:hypothetical protein